MPTVPMNPEPLSALQARYPRALNYVYAVDQIQQGRIRPGEVAANIFDFEDGLRLIVSRERFLNGQVLLHVSGSFSEHGPLATQLRRLCKKPASTQVWQHILDEFTQRFVALSGDTRPLRFLGVSEHRIPHFAITED